MNSRLDKIRKLIEEKNIDALLIKGKNNKRYIGALTGSGVYVLVTKDKAYQILDRRYIDEANKKTTIFENKVVPQGSYIQDIIDLLKELSLQKVGIESQFMSIREYIDLSECSFDISSVNSQAFLIVSISSLDFTDLTLPSSLVINVISKLHSLKSIYSLILIN